MTIPTQPDNATGHAGPASAEPKTDPRRQARICALQFLHQLDVQAGENLEQLDGFVNEQLADMAAGELAKQWIRGTWQNHPQIDRQISQVCRNWDLARINLVDLSNLRLALYQLEFCKDIPERVVINEAIELARLFSTTAAPGFVNGILDAVRAAKSGQEAEFAVHPPGNDGQ